eukprot:6181371-Pleurochrysis_carterae.AAC.3
MPKFSRVIRCELAPRGGAGQPSDSRSFERCHRRCRCEGIPKRAQRAKTRGVDCARTAAVDARILLGG